MRTPRMLHHNATSIKELGTLQPFFYDQAQGMDFLSASGGTDKHEGNSICRLVRLYEQEVFRRMRLSIVDVAKGCTDQCVS